MAADGDKNKPLVKDLHQHIVCPLCCGYLIDATTLVECLHSFCRGCIVRRLGSGARACPVCGAETLPPLLPDLTLQRLVYLSVPGLFRSELERRRHFRKVNPQCPPLAPPMGALPLTLEDSVSLSLEEIPTSRSRPGSVDEEDEEEEEEVEKDTRRKTRYLKCPAGVTVRHLVRLLALKRGWGEDEDKPRPKRIEVLYERVEKHGNDERVKEIRVLDLSWTLLDLACIFEWDKESPMKLFYRVVHRRESICPPVPSIESTETESSRAPSAMENVQRPPTPPPSPKQSGGLDLVVPVPAKLAPPPQSTRSSPFVEPVAPTLPETPTSPTSPGSPMALQSVSRSSEGGTSPVPPSKASVPCPESERREVKTKKPRCEVTPVMRAPDPVGCLATPETPKPSKVARIDQQHKRRKRRNKRLIAEITTTPREDLLKLKVRLTPCPPRITSGTGTAKDKLLQMRAVRRDKSKPSSESVTMEVIPEVGQEKEPASKVVVKEVIDLEETIEDIIDGIPDEVVRVAQNLNSPPSDKDKAAVPHAESVPGHPEERLRKGAELAPHPETPKSCHPEETPKSCHTEETPKSHHPEETLKSCHPEEVPKSCHPDDNRKQNQSQGPSPSLGISLTLKEKPHAEKLKTSNVEDKMDHRNEKTKSQLRVEKPKSEEVLRRLGLVAIAEASKTLQDKMKSSRGSTGIDYHRESLERQLRESKANRVRSLLAEKQMRDTLKSIMSKSKDQGKSGGGANNGPKKGPPPLAPLTLNSTGVAFSSSPPKSSHPVPRTSSGVTRTSGGTMRVLKTESPLDLSSGGLNALDLSPTPGTSSSPGSSGESVTKELRTKTYGSTTTMRKTSVEKKGGNQDLNLRTLSDAAVSLLTTGIGDHASPGNGTGNVNGTNAMVPLRIPQPSQRLVAGFGNGIKIKPNLAVRHIPNPQAFVASQYRNQRTNLFASHQQQ